MENTKKIAQAKQRWALKHADVSTQKPATTSWGSDLELIYTPDYSPEHPLDQDYLTKSGFPGQYPFTRGVYPTMYRGRLWTMRQYAGFGTPEETNARFLSLLEQGQTGLSVAFDLPTQIGYDSDDPVAEEEVGKVGVAVDSLKDMEIIFDNIPLDKITTSFTVNPTAAIIMAMYVVLAQNRGISLDKLGGTLQNDILKEYLARGTQIFPPGPSLRLTADIIEYCNAEVPRMNTISICGYHMREAGCSLIQESAYCLSDAVIYVEEVLKRGIHIDEFAPRLSFLLSCGMNLFEEVAKFRATRRLWAKIIKNRFHSKNANSMRLRMFSGCSASAFTDKEPLNNISRGTIMTMVAVLSGCQAIHTTAYDEAYAIPTEESTRTALRTQQIIAYETDAAAVVDPMGGSYFLEHLTDEIEKEVEKEMARIEEKGGMKKGISNGTFQRDIAKKAFEEEKKIQQGEKIIVGVNKFVSAEKEYDVEIFQADSDVKKCQIKRLNEIKAKRNNRQVKLLLDEIRRVAKGPGNLMGPILAAVQEYATIGEICNTLKKEFGEYLETY